MTINENCDKTYLKLWAFSISLLHIKYDSISFKINIIFTKRPLSNSVLFCWVSTLLKTYYSHTQFLLFTKNGRHEMKFKILPQQTHVALKAFQIWSHSQPAKKLPSSLLEPCKTSHGNKYHPHILSPSSKNFLPYIYDFIL